VSQGKKIDFYHRGNRFLSPWKLIFITLEIDFYHCGKWFFPPWKIDFYHLGKLIFTTVEN